jgi:hypothetical protein
VSENQHCPDSRRPAWREDYERDGLGGGVSDDVFEFDDGVVAVECFEYLDLSFDFALLDGLEGLDDDGLIVLGGDAGVDF